MKYLDNEGLLFLVQQLLTDIANAQANAENTAAEALAAAVKTIPSIDTAISSTSTNSVAAGAKAVYDYVTAAIANLGSLSAKIVNTLPTSGQKTNVIYLLTKSTAAVQNAYDEYMWIDNKWELIGTTAVDLSGYVKSSDLQALTNSEITSILAAAEGE